MVNMVSIIHAQYQHVSVCTLAFRDGVYSKARYGNTKKCYGTIVSIKMLALLLLASQFTFAVSYNRMLAY